MSTNQREFRDLMPVVAYRVAVGLCAVEVERRHPGRFAFFWGERKGTLAQPGWASMWERVVRVPGATWSFPYHTGGFG